VEKLRVAPEMQRKAEERPLIVQAQKLYLYDFAKNQVEDLRVALNLGCLSMSATVFLAAAVEYDPLQDVVNP